MLSENLKGRTGTMVLLDSGKSLEDTSKVTVRYLFLHLASLVSFIIKDPSTYDILAF